jgi:hypothetical protein
MSQSSNALSQEIAVLADVFSDLGDRLLRAARELHKPGTPPDATLIEEIEASRQDLESLRDRSRELAESLHVECPPPEALNSLHSLAALLDDVAEAEIRLSRSDEIRRRSHAVLQRVLAIGHTVDPDHAALRECQGLARGLHQQIADAAWTSLPAEAERLAEGDHPFAHLLSLIEDRDELGDDVWASHHEAVSNAFGKTLAAAAARSRLVIGSEVGHHSENGHHADPALAAAS